MAWTWVTPEIVEKIKIALDDGKTFEEIGVMFGKKRNAIAGVVFRNGLVGRSKVVNRNPKVNIKKPRIRVRKPRSFDYKVTTVRIKTKLEDYSIPTTAVSWEEYDGSVHCSWPVGDENKYCGGPKVAGSYCGYHHHVATKGLAREATEKRKVIKPSRINAFWR